MKKEEFCKDNLDKEIECIKDDIKNAFESGDLYKATCLIKYLSWFYYEIAYTYRDDEIEEMIRGIGHKYLGNNRISETDENRVVFYDGFGLLNRGLAAIYVDALLAKGYEVYWVLYEWAPDMESIKHDYPDVIFIVIPKYEIMERMKVLVSEIVRVRARHLFFYTLPNDVEGAVVFSSINGKIFKYLIDLTDHSYWIGADSVDCIIGFRSIGCNIAKFERGIDSHKIVMLPYYPQSRKRYEYEGMPFDDNQRFFFSGGNSYKIEGSSIYEEIVSGVLDRFPDLFFVYAHEKGNGYCRKLDLLKDKYGMRVVLIEERKDLDEVMRHADFYIETYPLGGGLIIQYALMNNCYPLSFCDENETQMNNPKTWLLYPEDIDFCFNSIEQMLNRIDEIETKEYIKKRKRKLSDHIISKECFEDELDNIMRNSRTKFVIDDTRADIRKFQDIYIKRFSFEEYCEIIRKSRNKWIIEKYAPNECII